MNNEPVAWWTGKFEDEGEDFMFTKTRQAHIDHPQSCTYEFFPIPLFTHSAKEKYLSLQKVDGELVAVTYTDDEHRIIEVLWEKPPAKTLTDEEILEELLIPKSEWDSYKAHHCLKQIRAILRKAQEK